VEVDGWWKQKVVAQIMECEGIFVPQIQFCILNKYPWPILFTD